MKRRLLLAPIVASLLVALMPGSALGQKTDSVTVRNGDRMLGEIKELQRGQLKFKTDAMKTVYVEWPKVVTVKTDKVFEILLDDGRIYYGSLTPGTQDSVVIKTERLPQLLSATGPMTRSRSVSGVTGGWPR